MLLDLDQELKLPEAILSEQILVSAGVTRDHQLMIRTALQGRMSVENVCNELIAQHSRIHEQERRAWSQKGSMKTYPKGKNYGKGYYVEAPMAYHAEEFETRSQSLGGYDMEESPNSAYNAAEHYETEYEDTQDDDPYGDTLAALLSEGLDENDQEAVEYAAEVLQIDAESYYVHQRAQQAGHTGFGREKGYGKGKTKMSPDDRTARIDAIKRRTTCRRCGQVGHWSTDYACPKGRGKGAPKGAGSTTASTASTATSLGRGRGGPGKPVKPRTVYFTVNEYKDVDEKLEKKVYVVRGYNQVPPPGSLQDGAVVRTSSEGVLVEGPSPGSATSADEMLDAAIARAHAERAQRRARPAQMLSAGSSAGPANAHAMVSVPEEVDWEAMDYEEEDLPLVPALPQRFNAFGGPPPKGRAERGPDATPSPVYSGEVTPAEECEHKRTTKQGSNDKKECITCWDCKKLLSSKARTPTVKMEVNAREECKHENRHFRGTSGTTWKWTCEDCGHSETGKKNPG